ncbi:prepilin peptidase [Syntrophorhabdus aromaticivorans]|uniref:Prepilin leader peptidase/N-methyltransferase n=1 Tax=Syntrophorhabdus aromaticivorans TaxID=328301 RepID=A0A971M6E2_9BACT|nr:A24 family peptidase [Syntrophorhabdus aromaticivorans]NLW36352.1 prepilin peptidase [Syntrophorhabdus aromaticivorans]
MSMVVQIFFFLLGSVVGSFLNVCIYRLPREKSIVHPPSSCPGCEKPIRFYDNIPIVSYILLKGTCRDCGAKISIRYPIVELLTGILYVTLLREFGLTFELAVFLLFVSLLVIISFIDLDFRIIPDILSIGGLVAGFILAIPRPFFKYLSPKFGILDSLYGILVGGGILFAIAWIYEFFTKREGMGGGDIKLLGMIGAFCGIKGVVFSLVSASFIGTLVGIPLILAKGRDTKYAIPFGPFLSLGALIYVYRGDSLIRLLLDILLGNG